MAEKLSTQDHLENFKIGETRKVLVGNLQEFLEFVNDTEIIDTGCTGEFLNLVKSKEDAIIQLLSFAQKIAIKYMPIFSLFKAHFYVLFDAIRMFGDHRMKDMLNSLHKDTVSMHKHLIEVRQKNKLPEKLSQGPLAFLFIIMVENNFSIQNTEKIASELANHVKNKIIIPIDSSLVKGIALMRIGSEINELADDEIQSLLEEGNLFGVIRAQQAKADRTYYKIEKARNNVRLDGAIKNVLKIRNSWVEWALPHVDLETYNTIDSFFKANIDKLEK